MFPHNAVEDIEQRSCVKLGHLPRCILLVRDHEDRME